MFFLGGGGGMPPLPLGPLVGIGATVLVAIAVVLILRAVVRAVSRKVRELAARRRGRHS